MNRLLSCDFSLVSHMTLPPPQRLGHTYTSPDLKSGWVVQELHLATEWTALKLKCIDFMRAFQEALRLMPLRRVHLEQWPTAHRNAYEGMGGFTQVASWFSLPKRFLGLQYYIPLFVTSL